MRSPFVVFSALLVLALATASTSIESATPAVPLFLWGGSANMMSRIAALNGAQYLQSFGLWELEVCVSRLLGGGATTPTPTAMTYAKDAHCPLLERTNTDNDVATSATTPELLLLVLTPRLSTTLLSRYSHAYSAQPDGGAFKHLQAALTSSARSVTVPYASLAETPTAVSYALATTLRRERTAGASVVLAGASDGALAPLSDAVVPLAALNDYLNQHRSLFSNGVTDVVVVNFDEPRAFAAPGDVEAAFARDDELLGSLVDTVNTLAGGRYLALYTAHESFVPSSVEFAQANQRTHTFERALNARAASPVGADDDHNSTNPVNPTGPNMRFWPSSIVAGVMAGLFLALVLGGALYMLYEIQTPTRFETPSAARKAQ